MKKDKDITYSNVGVNIAAGNEAVEGIKRLVAATRQPWVLVDVGPFAGLVRLKPLVDGYRDPVLVQSTDGVGTKTIIAGIVGKLDTVGKDLVCHCANDVLCLGAEPKIFLDYIGTDKLNPDVIENIIRGMADACREIECSIVGGEMAEMPDIYRQNNYDLVGFMTGLVEYDKIIDGSKIQPDDQIIGLASSGIHTNGYSFAREICFERRGLKVNDYIEELGTTLGEELLRPHRCYVKPVLQLLAEGLEVHGIAHITGGGIAGNLIRILSEGCRAVIYKSRWPVPSIFSFIQGDGWVDEEEMFRAFNMGIGMIIVVPGRQAGRAAQRLEWYLGAQEGDRSLGTANKFAFQIGDIKQGEKGVEII